MTEIDWAALGVEHRIVFECWESFAHETLMALDEHDNSLECACRAGFVAIKVNGIQRVLHGTVC